MIYLDNAATTLRKPPEVIHAVNQAMETMGNPGRGAHKASSLAAQAVFHCREVAAALFDSSPANVVFAPNATHGLNIAIQSVIPRGSHVVISGFEHNSVTRPLTALNAEVSVAGNRLFDREYSIQSFTNAIRQDTAAVIVNHVSNAFGFIQPLEEIAEICDRKQVPLIVDAAQSAGVLQLSAEKLHAAFIAMPGHKSLFGPQGSGILLCGAKTKPLLYGGTGNESLQQTMPEDLPERLEAGTVNVPGICGLCAGMEFVLQTGLKTIKQKEHELMQFFCDEMMTMQGVRVFRDLHGEQIGSVSAVFPNADCEFVAEKLSHLGIAVRSGLHCAPLAHQSAGTVKTGTVRFSFSAMNTKREVYEVLKIIQKNYRLLIGKP